MKRTDFDHATQVNDEINRYTAIVDRLKGEDTDGLCLFTDHTLFSLNGLRAKNIKEDLIKSMEEQITQLKKYFDEI